MDLTISIVTYNHEDIIIDTLASIIENISEGLKYEIVIVDNSSQDKTVEVISSAYPKIHIIKSQNKGFGYGHNQSILTNDSRYHLVYNPDLLLQIGVVEQLIERMDARNEIMISIPKFRYKNGELQTCCKTDPTLFDAFSRKFFSTTIKKISLIEKRMKKYELLDRGYTKEMSVPVVSGAFMMCRGDIIRTEKGFDDRFFMYYEDQDLCRRMRSHGELVFFPDLEVIHLWERGAYKNLNLMKIMISSMIKYFNKWEWKFI
jgi:GT2 family glycosyltransferase